MSALELFLHDERAISVLIKAVGHVHSRLFTIPRRQRPPLADCSSLLAVRPGVLRNQSSI